MTLLNFAGDRYATYETHFIISPQVKHTLKLTRGGGKRG